MKKEVKYNQLQKYGLKIAVFGAEHIEKIKKINSELNIEYIIINGKNKEDTNKESLTITEFVNKKIEYDYLIITGKEYKKIKAELIEYGIDKEKILCDTMFSSFDINRALHYKKLGSVNKDITIFSNSCSGAFLYNMIDVPYNSPLIWMFLSTSDYIKFLEKLDYYLEQELEVEFDYIRNHPIGTLGDLKLLFNHYKTCDDAYEKFNERKMRINKDNILIEGIFSLKDDIDKFLNLDYSNKLVITDLNYNHECVESFSDWRQYLESKWFNLNEFWQFANFISFKYINFYKYLNKN